MSKKESTEEYLKKIDGYLNDVYLLDCKLTGADRETLDWLISAYALSVRLYGEDKDKIDKAKQYYLKELSMANIENKTIDKVAVNMFNLLEGNLNNMLAEGIEPDLEDIYLAEIEGKTKDCDKYKQALNEIREKLLKLNDKFKSVSGIPFDIKEIVEMIEVIDKVIRSNK